MPKKNKPRAKGREGKSQLTAKGRDGSAEPGEAKGRDGKPVTR